MQILPKIVIFIRRHFLIQNLLFLAKIEPFSEKLLAKICEKHDMSNFLVDTVITLRDYVDRSGRNKKVL